MSHLLDHLPTGLKIGGEVAAVGTIAGAFMHWLPAVAAAFAILWHLVLLYDWIRKKKRHRRSTD